jgi:hypothetical protein
MTNKFKVAGHVAWRRVGEEVVVLDLNSSTYYSLNETGAAMWELFAKSASLEEVAKRVAEDYDAAADKVKKDADGLLKRFCKAHLLEPA